MIRNPITLLLGLGVAAAMVAAFAPLEVAMLGVLAFAGPHNWFELRYLLGRLPSRLWVFRWYFVVATAGLVVLSFGSIAISWFGHYRPQSVGLALLAPGLAPFDPYAPHVTYKYAPPGTIIQETGQRFWFGADQLGRDRTVIVEPSPGQRGRLIDAVADAGNFHGCLAGWLAHYRAF